MYKKKDMEIIRTTIESLDLKKAKELIKNYDINYILGSALLLHFNKLSSNDKAYRYIKYLIRLGGNINSIDSKTNIPLISRLILFGHRSQDYKIHPLWFGDKKPDYKIHPLLTEYEVIQLNNAVKIKENNPNCDKMPIEVISYDIENWKKIIDLGLDVNTKWEYRPNWSIVKKEYSIFDAMVRNFNTEGVSLLIKNGLTLSKVNFVKPIKDTLGVTNGSLEGFLSEDNLNKLIALYCAIGVDFTANNNELIKLMLKYNFFDLSRFMINEALEKAVFEDKNHKNKKWLEKKLKALDSSNE